jgi:hypothetical protein
MCALRFGHGVDDGISFAAHICAKSVGVAALVMLALALIGAVIGFAWTQTFARFGARKWMAYLNPMALATIGLWMAASRVAYRAYLAALQGTAGNLSTSVGILVYSVGFMVGVQVHQRLARGRAQQEDQS